MSENSRPAKLLLTVSLFARRGEKIVATISGTNVSDTIVELNAPDTVVISKPHRQFAGSGTFERTIEWTIEHVPTSSVVEIIVCADAIVQRGLCKIVG